MAKKTTETQATSRIQELEQKLAETEAQWKRAAADYQNLEKRTREQNSLMIQLAGLSMIEKLLPLADHLAMAENHLKDPGLTMVVKQLQDILASEGVKKIEVLGKPFDPQLMESVELTEGEKDRVTEVTVDGYSLGDRVIRPAKVKVGTGIQKINKHI